MKKNNINKKLILFIFVFFILDFGISKFLLIGLNKYYGLGDNSEIAFVGHSHLMLGVDKQMIEQELDVTISKYTREGVNVEDRQVMVKQLLAENKNLKTVIYGVDAWTFSSEGLSSNSYKLFYPFMNDPVINDFVYESTNKSDYWTKKIIKTTRYNELLLSGALRGYLGKWDNLKFGKVDTLSLKEKIKSGDFREIKNTSSNIKFFNETLELLSENNIKVILMYVPTIDILRDNQEVKYKETIALFDAISKKSHNINFVNFQEPWSHNYDLFYDPIHMNPEGQKVVTKELIKYLKSSGLLKK
ncbi:hypothetical protein H0I23_01525 [Cellulophaga sp. HaHaR_3_176]|nr:hypothetical protein H0I23_01525 [Cellulophaga sp. HaHaR_3_176]